MYNLANLYKRRGEHDLALKYFEMCSAGGGSKLADMEIADIYYYGLTGITDHEKAFRYYSAAAKIGFPKAKLRLADMYKNGLYVKQDDEQYRILIFDVYNQIRDSPLPNYKGETFLKLTRIYIEEGFEEGAFELLLAAQSELADQLRSYTDNSDLYLMNQIVEFQYELMQPEIDENREYQLYDLYHILKNPVRVEFIGNTGKHYVSSFKEPSGITVEFDGKWFRSIDEFFYGATIDGERLSSICNQLFDFRII